MNSKRGGQYFKNNRNRFYDRGRSYDKSRNYNKNTQNLKVGNNFREIGVKKNITEVTKEFVMKETCLEIGRSANIEEGLRGAEVKVDPEIQTGLIHKTEVRKECVIIAENQDILRGSVKRRRDQIKQE